MTERYAVSASFDVPVTTRDGTDLATDIYRPANPDTGRPVTEPMPALLSRTPYDKTGQLDRHGRWFAKRGYVVAVQDTRGRFESDGEFTLFLNEASDGADAVEWLADRPYCDGQVGTIGSGTLQSAIATQDPDGLAAMFVNQGAANGRKKTYRHHGAVELRWLCWAFTAGAAYSQRALEDPTIQRAFAEVDMRDLFASGPVGLGETPLRHVPEYEEWVFDILTEGRADSDRWQSPGINFESHYEESADCPTAFSGGWYDSYTGGTCDNFVGLNGLKDSDYYLLVGPWTHGWDRYPYPSWNKPYAGEIAFGEEAIKSFQETRLRFFDHYLKDKETWTEQPTVEYMMMGTGDGHRTGNGRLFHGGEWQTGTDWPLPETEYTAYYAHPNGTLSRDQPTVATASTTYDFDPENPVPTVGGNLSANKTFEQTNKRLLEYPLSKRRRVDFVPGGGFDQRTREDTFGASSPYEPLERRDDVVTFRTPPLDERVEIAGAITITVYAATDAHDTDFTAKLIEEYPPTEDYPDGFALNLTDSIVRGRYRDYREEPDLLEPGRTYEFHIHPYPTANVFGVGHRIRLDLSSSNFPRFDVNHNTGGPLYYDREYEIATNTIYHDAEHPTNIELPIQPPG